MCVDRYANLIDITVPAPKAFPRHLGVFDCSYSKSWLKYRLSPCYLAILILPGLLIKPI